MTYLQSLVLSLLARLGSARWLSRELASAAESVSRLGVESILNSVVDACETSGLATTDSGAETEDEDRLRVLNLELLSQEACDEASANSTRVGVEDVHNLIV